MQSTNPSRVVNRNIVGSVDSPARHVSVEASGGQWYDAFAAFPGHMCLDLARMYCIMYMQSIQIEIQVAGDGKNYPKPGQTVSVHYTGFVRAFAAVCSTLARLFTCSICLTAARWEAIRLHLRQGQTVYVYVGRGASDHRRVLLCCMACQEVDCCYMLAGLDEAVSQLSVGDVAKVIIPASKAYGRRGLPGLYVFAAAVCACFKLSGVFFFFQPSLIGN